MCSLMAPAFSLPGSKTVCVFDAAGRLGTALVEKLLKRGYIVHAASSNLGLWKENRQLKAFHSDPLDYHSIASAIRGCSGVFYCFEPPSEHSVYDELMVEMEVRAANNVLEACAHSDTIEKVVFTSSVTAVIWKENRNVEVELDERDWSELQFCRKLKMWYALAKTLSEKSAWALAMDRGVDMLSINSGLLIGPELSVESPYLKGSPEMYRDGVLVTVDIDFLVDAHICVFESQSAYGRYICFNHAICCPDDAFKLTQMLTSVLPCSPPLFYESRGDDLRVSQQRIQNRKLQKLTEESETKMEVPLPLIECYQTEQQGNKWLQLRVEIP